VLASWLVNAQNDCQTKLSLFAENVKTKRFEEAKPQLAFLRKNCKTFNYVIYARGAQLLQHELRKVSDKKQVALDLIQLYKDRLEFFPERTKKGIFLPRIASLMIRYEIGNIVAQYKLLNEAFSTDATHFTHPRMLYRYFELYYKKYTAKTFGISIEDLMEKYETVKAKLTLEQEKSTKNKNAIATFLKNLDILASKEATCETLIPMYEKKFSTEATNVEWLRKAAGQLDAKGCKDDPLFVELVEAIDKNEPNAASKLYLWKIHERLGNSAKANTYFEAYLTLETDGEKKANVLHGEAQKAAKAKQKTQARSLYLEALKANPTAGKIYLNLARLYASSANECGTDEFTKRAIYWKAATTARKAGSVDSSVRSEANSLVASYMQSAPSKTDIFNKTYKGGEKIPLKCWVGGFVVVPKL
jgi:hypothetical protein